MVMDQRGAVQQAARIPSACGGNATVAFSPRSLL